MSDPGNPSVEVRGCELGKGVFAVRDIPAGEVVVPVPPVFTARPDSHSIQIDEDRHQPYTGDVDDFVNHGCRPNCFLDVGQMAFVALVDIAADDEITFNYNTSEWDMVVPFYCSCDGRRRRIRGFRHLSDDERRELEPIVVPWMLSRLRQETARSD